MMDDMGTIATSMTFEEFERLPDDEFGKLELVDGEVISRPPAETDHMRIAKRLCRIIEDALTELHRSEQARELGEVLIETGYHFGRNWVIPDVSISHAGQPEGKYLEGGPALAIEVISESNTVRMMSRKVKLYFEHGAREVWLVYPEFKSVWVHRGKAAVEVEGTLTTELLPGATIDLSTVFGRASQ
jgi:Uma2 family endonuclease